MNKCVECGKFRRWDDLEFHFDADLMTGDANSYYEDSYYTCVKGKGCRA